MRNSIPAYAQRIAPLYELLESCYKKAGKGTKQALRKFSITTSWSATHDAAFADIKKQLTVSVKLAFPRFYQNLCLFTDASNTHCSAVPTEYRSLKLENQRHEPLCFLSGVFSGSSGNWSVPEKEGYAIVEAICRLDFLVLGREVTIFTDHANLVYLYDPYGHNSVIARHTASKLMRHMAITQALQGTLLASSCAGQSSSVHFATLSNIYQESSMYGLTCLHDGLSVRSVRLTQPNSCALNH